MSIQNTTCIILLCLSFTFVVGCEKNEDLFRSGMGKKPVYVSYEALLDIKNEAPRPIGLTGTIFLKDSLFFLLEQRKGIHVFNIKDSLNTKNLTFISIPAVTDFTVTDNFIYADSWKDLVVIDISDLYKIKVANRIVNVLQPVLYPLLYNGVFECVDESKGAIVEWKDELLEDAKCVTTN